MSERDWLKVLRAPWDVETVTLRTGWNTKTQRHEGPTLHLHDVSKGESGDMTDDEIEAMLVAAAEPDAMARRAAWLADRPKAVQELAERYPPHLAYRVKDGAPYGFTTPGTIVGIYSIVEDDAGCAVKVRVLKSAPGEFTDRGILFGMDPKWLEPWTPPKPPKRETGT